MQPPALALSQPTHQRLPITPDHVAHGAEAKASQALLELGPDERDVRQRELQHEVGLRSGGYDVHAIRRPPGARLGEAGGELRYELRRPTPDGQ